MVNENDKKLTCRRTNCILNQLLYNQRKRLRQRKKICKKKKSPTGLILSIKNSLSSTVTVSQGRRNQCSLNKCTHIISQIWLCWFTPSTLNYSTENLLPVLPHNYSTKKTPNKHGAVTKGRNWLQILEFKYSPSGKVRISP